MKLMMLDDMAKGDAALKRNEHGMGNNDYEFLDDRESFKQIDFVHTFSIDNDDPKVLGEGSFHDDAIANSQRQAPNQNSCSKTKRKRDHDDFLVYTTDLSEATHDAAKIEPRGKIIEGNKILANFQERENSRTRFSDSRSRRPQDTRLVPSLEQARSGVPTFNFPSSPQTRTKIRSPPSSPVVQFPSLVTPEEAEALVHSPKWNLEQQSIMLCQNKPYHTGIALKPKLSRKPFCDDWEESQQIEYFQANWDSKSASLHEGKVTSRPQLLGGPFPTKLKPIVRILLYLEQTMTNQEIVRKAFEIVQTCYDHHQGGEGDIGLLTGTIFESMVDILGTSVELAPAIAASRRFESPELESYCFQDECTTQPKKKFAPNLLQLAVAYGAHLYQLNSEMNDPEHFVLSGAETVQSMAAEEKSKFWNSFSHAQISKP